MIVASIVRGAEPSAISRAIRSCRSARRRSWIGSSPRYAIGASGPYTLSRIDAS
jgi:hypothetical protein